MNSLMKYFELNIDNFERLRISTPEEKERWLTRPFWTAEQAAALSMGFDPEKLSAAQAETPECEYASICARRLEIITEMQRRGYIGTEIKPDELIHCLAELGLPAERTPGFVAKNEPTEHNIVSDSNQQISEDLNSKERTSLYKMVLTMAILNYGFRPGMLRSSVSKKIHDQARLLGRGDNLTVWASHAGRIAIQRWFWRTSDELRPSA